MPITKPLTRRPTKKLFIQKPRSVASSTSSPKAATPSGRPRTRSKKPLFAAPSQAHQLHPSHSLSSSTPFASSHSEPNVRPTPPPPADNSSRPWDTPARAFSPAPSPLPTSPSPSSQTEVDRSFSPPPTSPATSKTSGTEIDALKHLIEQTSVRLQELETERIEAQSEESSPAEDPDEFNGIDSAHEQHQLYEGQLEKLEKENKKLYRQLELVKTEFTQEKAQLDKTIREMQAELRRTAPIQESKFFSISKDLRDAVKAIETLNDPDYTPDVIDPGLVATAAATETSSTPPATTPTSTPPTEPKKITVSPPPKSEQKASVTGRKPTSKDKKLLITGGAIISLLSVGGLASWKLTSAPKVNQELVDAYLEQQGQVQGIQTDSTIAAQNKNVPTNKFQEASFDQTDWLTFEEPILGFQLQFPSGLVEKLATGSSVTFLRKDGYLFKVQTYPSELTPQEFWEQQKSTINYTAMPTELAGRETLHLRLEDQVDFPGDRYLIQSKGMLYDIWVANPSNKFSADDIQRAEFMLKSFRVL